MVFMADLERTSAAKLVVTPFPAPLGLAFEVTFIGRADLSAVVWPFYCHALSSSSIAQYKAVTTRGCRDASTIGACPGI